MGVTRRGLTVLLMGLWALALYGPVLGHGFVFDDLPLIVNNPAVGDFSTLGEALRSDLFHFSEGVRTSPYWRPLVTLSYYLDHRLGGGAPSQFHRTNLVLLTAVAVILVWLLQQCKVPAFPSFLLGAVFLAHPLQVEGAANVAGRTDLICAAFALAALSCRRPVASAFLVLLACGGKETAVLIPLVAWMLDRGGTRWRWQAGAVALFLVLRVLVFQGLELLPEDRGGPSGASLWGAGARVWFWLGRLTFPTPMGPAADLLPQTGVIAGAGWVGFVLLAGLAWRMNNVQRAGALLVLGPLLLVSGLLQASPRYGDTLTLLPLAGLVLLVGTSPFLASRAAPAGLCCCLAVYAALGWGRVAEWESPLALWEAAHERAPEDRVVRLNLARARLEQDPKGVLQVLDPEVWPRGSRQRREAAAVLSKALLQLGLEDEALRWLGQAVGEDPEAAWANGTSCVLLAARGSRAAGGICELAVDSLPEDPDVLNAMGITRIVSGGAAAALPWFESAAQLAPDRREFAENRDRAAAAVSGR